MTELSLPAVAVPSAQAPKRRSRRSWVGWRFVGPFMVVFTLVFLAPIAYSIYLSLFRDQLVGGNSFVGLTNYRTPSPMPSSGHPLGGCRSSWLFRCPSCCPWRC
jgi:multiple sugar transport system permease protein